MVQSRALLLKEPGVPPEITAVEVLDPTGSEVLVRMVASGVCATDRHMVDGRYPMPVSPVLLGHEGAGIVEAVGPAVPGLSVGDHVVFARTASCGTCRECRRGKPEDCNGEALRRGLLGIQPDGRTRVRLGDRDVYPLYGGTHSEYMTLPSDQVVRIDPEAPLDLLCLAGCALVTGLGAVVNLAGVSLGDSVVVVGCGGVGLSVVQAARIAGATTIVAVDPVPAKRALAARLGATHTIDAGHSVGAALAEIVPGGVDAAFEVVGLPDLVADCLSFTRVGGTTVMVGVPPAGATIPLDGLAMMGNRRIVGCRGGAVVPHRDIPLLVDLYRAGRLDLATLVDRRVPLDDIHIALDDLNDAQLMRTVVTFD